MTSCDGCGKILGFKKYKFHRMWRIEGKYCRECMLVLGKEFDQYARITIPKRRCDLCDVEFYFLKSKWSGKERKHYCNVCNEAISNGAIPNRSRGNIPAKVPRVMTIFAGLAVLMMALGLIYTIAIAPKGDGNLLGVLFGSATTALGFVLFRRTLRSRSLIMSKLEQPMDSGKISRNSQ